LLLCGSKLNGGERNIQSAIYEIPKLDISKKPHWHFVLQKCLPEGYKVPLFCDRKKIGWQCWECSPLLYTKNLTGEPGDVTSGKVKEAETIDPSVVDSVQNGKPTDKTSEVMVEITTPKEKAAVESSVKNRKPTDDTIDTKMPNLKKTRSLNVQGRIRNLQTR
jgi:hypothetical protein